MEAFQHDTSPHKMDLGVGVYRNAEGRTPVMAAIRSAQNQLSKLETTRTYLGPMGWPGFTDAAATLMFGAQFADSESARLATVPAVGGWGALRLAGELIQRARPNATVWLSDPTWLNHAPLFESCGLKIAVYPYYSAAGRELERDAMMRRLGQVSMGDVVVLHGCCHNPTGEDLTPHDWEAIATMLKDRDATPLIDIAYHGFAGDLDTDLSGARRLAEQMSEAIVCYSFSKNMGLYRDRVGAVSMLCESQQAAFTARAHLIDIARRHYFMPPTFGEALAFLTLSTPKLYEAWSDELLRMRERVDLIRNMCADAFRLRINDDSFEYLRRQRGMFSLLPIDERQDKILRETHSVHTALAGRINFCGLSEERVDDFVTAVADVL